jgi:biopolymer transport protein ExbD
VSEGRLRVRLPEASAAPVPGSTAEAIVVTVTERGEYRVNDRELVNPGRDTLRAALQKVAGSQRTARITLRADGRATHQSVVTAMDVLGRMGFAELNVATVNDTPAP